MQITEYRYIDSFHIHCRLLKLQRNASRLQLSSSSRDSPQLESPELDADISARPWSFDVPTMREMQEEKDWPRLVTDWELFWTRLTVWQQYVERSRRKNARPSHEYEEWWELDTADSEARKQKVKEVQEVCCPPTVPAACPSGTRMCGVAPCSVW